ncbi:hypothetical protein D3C85_848840 [compost metagenome]
MRARSLAPGTPLGDQLPATLQSDEVVPTQSFTPPELAGFVLVFTPVTVLVLDA